jgi:hypothetical protein
MSEEKLEFKLEPRRTAMVVIDLQEGIVGIPAAGRTLKRTSLPTARVCSTLHAPPERSRCWSMWAARRMALTG